MRKLSALYFFQLLAGGSLLSGCVVSTTSPVVMRPPRTVVLQSAPQILVAPPLVAAQPATIPSTAGINNTAGQNAGLAVASTNAVLPQAVAPGTIVVQQPPLAQVEVIPVAPAVGYVWLPGYWGWRGGWFWISGRWVLPPHPRSVWVPGRWVRYRHGWTWTAGRWR